MAAACGLALALVGFDVGSAGTAFGQNVTAFNPYNGVGLPGAPAAQPSRRPGTQSYGAVAETPPSAGLAFNPWIQSGAYASPVTAYAGPPPYQPPGSSASASYSRGSNLPAPPPGPIESRLIAIPEPPPKAASVPAPARPATEPPVPLVRSEPPPVATAAPPPAPVPIQPPAAPPVAAQTPAPSTPPVVVTPAPKPAATPAPPPAETAAPAAAPPPPVASATPAPRERPAPPPATSAPISSISFASDSAEITDAIKAELNQVATAINSQGARQVELRAVAGGSDQAEARKVALARALGVRSYLIDQGVKARIEVGAFGGGGGERVDVLVR
ncbi:MAG TPA: OmpA family protein [Reyranella sp.]|nr:OmpA family protein [Reyranella sp.]